MTYAEVAEGVRAAIAAYTHALDDGRTDVVVAMFCTDGSSEMPRSEPAHGHDALRTMYERFKPRAPQRHLVANTLVTDWNDHEATAVSDVMLLVHGDAGWSVAFVGRYRDTLHYTDGGWRFHRRVLTADG
jgi:hypothetical protein